MNLNKRYFVAIFLICSFIFREHLLLRTYVGWDTFDAYTVNFIYFSDSLKSGIFPFWNPFVMGGVSTFVNSFTYVLYSPIDLFFLFLSLFVHPVYCVELQIFLAFIVFTLGMFKLSKRINSQNLFLNYVASVSCAITLFLPILGQISILYSFACLPWLLFSVLFILNSEKPSIKTSIFLGLLCSLLYSKGYFYFNIMIVILSIVFFAINVLSKKSKLKYFINFSVLQIFCNLNFLILLYPSYADIMKKYLMFSSSLVLAEPRLRSVIPTGYVNYPSFFESTRALFFPQSYNSLWITGVGYFGIALICSMILFGFFRIKNFKFLIFSLLVLFFGILFSYNSSIAKFILNYSNILASFRWTGTNLYFSIFAFYLIIFSFEKKHKNNFYMNIVLLAFFTFCVVSLPKRVMPFDKYFVENSEWLKRSSQNFPYENLSVDLGLNHRQIGVFSKNNFRKLNNNSIFQYNDSSWLINKVPISHGYLNTVDPIYWALKDMPILSKLIFATENSLENESVSRSSEDTDNQFYSKLTRTFLGKTCDSMNEKFCVNVDNDVAVSMFILEPNKLKIQVESDHEFYLNINNQFKSNWSARIDGKFVDVVKSNLIFQSIHVPRGAREIILKYRPYEEYFLLFYYFGVLIFIFYYVDRSKKQKPIQGVMI